MRLVVTGGAGFIGSNFVRYMLRRYDDLEVVNLDKLTYAGNLENLRDVEDDARYTFVKGDICDAAAVRAALRGADAVVNFAAETHVDRSISGPQDFIRTDVLGTHTLLEAVRELGIARYLQISTDEVYGSTETGSFTEESDLAPSSPYSASKAGADLLVLAYHRTFGTPVLITRSSNNYGPYQYPEKVIPLFITNAIDEQALAGVRRRPQRARLAVRRRQLRRHRRRAAQGRPTARCTTSAAATRWRTSTLTRRILELLGKSPELIRFVTDRPGHDRRYSIDCAKLRALGWQPGHAVRDRPGAHRRLVPRQPRSGGAPIKSGEWREYYERQYAELALTGRQAARPAPAHGTFHTGVPTCTRSKSHRMCALESRVQPCE